MFHSIRYRKWIYLLFKNLIELIFEFISKPTLMLKYSDSTTIAVKLSKFHNIFAQYLPGLSFKLLWSLCLFRKSCVFLGLIWFWLFGLFLLPCFVIRFLVGCSSSWFSISSFIAFKVSIKHFCTKWHQISINGNILSKYNFYIEKVTHILEGVVRDLKFPEFAKRASDELMNKGCDWLQETHRWSDLGVDPPVAHHELVVLGVEPSGGRPLIAHLNEAHLHHSVDLSVKTYLFTKI